VRLFSKILQIGLATEPLPQGGEDVIRLLHEVDAHARRLFGGALAIREVDAGSCNGCEIEITGLTGPVYDSERFGVHFVASPRHADLLLVTGPVTRKLVVGVGDCARSCGVFKGSYAVAGSVDQFIPVDAFVGGCPPDPVAILQGILAAIGRR